MSDRLVRVLLICLCIWQGVLTWLVATRDHPAPSPPAAQSDLGSLNLDELSMGILLLEVDPSLALTPAQAQKLADVEGMIDSNLGGRNPRNARARAMLEAYVARRVLTPEQLHWIAGQRRLLLGAASGGHAWVRKQGLAGALGRLVAERGRSTSPSLATRSEAPPPHMRDFLAGLVKLEAMPGLAVTPAQARAMLPAVRAIEQELAQAAHGRKSRRPPPVGAAAARLTAAQRSAIAKQAHASLRVDGRPCLDREVGPLAVELLMATARGQAFRHAVALARQQPAEAAREPSPQPAVAAGEPSGQSPAPAAPPDHPPAAPRLAPPPPPASPLPHLDGPDDRLVLSQILVGIVRLEKAPGGLALDRAQAVRLRAVMPQVLSALAAHEQGRASDRVPHAEYELKLILRRQQKAYIGKHVPPAAEMAGLAQAVNALVNARAAGRKVSATAP